MSDVHVFFKRFFLSSHRSIELEDGFLFLFFSEMLTGGRPWNALIFARFSFSSRSLI